MILVVAKHHKNAHHKHAHHKNDDPLLKLRKLAVPISLIVILMYAAQWAVRFPHTAATNLAAGIAIAAAATALWILHPRKAR